jgi:hypothetical protein
LKWLPYGGLYLTGGLTPKFIDLIKDPNGPFLEAFLDKGRVSGMLCGVPLYAVMEENLGQRGAHLAAYQDLAAIYSQQQGYSRHGSSVKGTASQAIPMTPVDLPEPSSLSKSAATSAKTIHSDTDSARQGWEDGPVYAPDYHQRDLMSVILPMSIAFVVGMSLSQAFARFFPRK